MRNDLDIPAPLLAEATRHVGVLCRLAARIGSDPWGLEAVPGPPGTVGALYLPEGQIVFRFRRVPGGSVELAALHEGRCLASRLNGGWVEWVYNLYTDSLAVVNEVADWVRRQRLRAQNQRHTCLDCTVRKNND